MIDFDKTVMELAIEVSSKSTCLRRKVGAVVVPLVGYIVKGYNRVPNYSEPCSDCYRLRNNIPSGQMLNVCKAIHAEQAAIIEALKDGLTLFNASIYVTTFPCSNCAKLIIDVGITHVFYLEDYNDDFSKNLFKEAGVEIHKVTL